jgi:hypothetical protein
MANKPQAAIGPALHFGTVKDIDRKMITHICVGIREASIREAEDGAMIAMTKLDPLQAVQAIRALSDMLDLLIRSQNGEHIV